MKHLWRRIVNTNYFDESAPFAPELEINGYLARCQRCGSWRFKRTRSATTFGHSPFTLNTGIISKCRDISFDLDNMLSKQWYRRFGEKYRKIKLGRLYESYVLDQWGEWINIAEKAPLIIIFNEQIEDRTSIIDTARIVWLSLANEYYLTKEQLAIKDVIE